MRSQLMDPVTTSGDAAPDVVSRVRPAESSSGNPLQTCTDDATDGNSTSTPPSSQGAEFSLLMSPQQQSPCTTKSCVTTGSVAQEEEGLSNTGGGGATQAMGVGAASIFFMSTTDYSSPKLPPPSLAAPSPWSSGLHFIAWPFEAAYKFTFTDSILPEDDFVVRVRKAAVGGLLLAYLTQILNFIFIWETVPLTVSLFVLCVCVIPLAIIHIGGFLYCRTTMSAPVWLVSLVSLSPLFGRCFLTVTNRTVDMEPASFAYLMVALCTRLPGAVEITAVVITVIGLVMNTLILQSPSVAQWLLFPDVGASTTSDLFKHLTGSRLTFVVTTVVFLVIIRHFYFVLTSKDASVKLCRQIGERLQKYDTQGAWSLLRGRTDDEADSLSMALLTHHVDPDLVKIFEGIVENLERYRPFLPNYVLDSAMHDSTIQGSIGERPMMSCTSRGDLESLAAAKTVLSQKRTEGMGVNSTTGTTSPMSTHHQHHPHTPAAPLVSFLLEPPAAATAAPFTSAFGRSNHSTTDRLSSGGGSSSTTLMKISSIHHHHQQPREKSITLMPMNEQTENAAMRPVVASPRGAITSNTLVSVCVMSVMRNDAARADFGAVTLWNTFVGIVNDVAQSTGASLHSFLGDRLIATWNGTMRVSKPEVRACQFPLRVRAKIAANTMMRSAFQLSSMVTTRQAECCFAGNANLRLFACSSPELWRHVYAGLQSIESLHVSVADWATKETAIFDIAFHAGALLMPPTVTTQRDNQQPQPMPRKAQNHHEVLQQRCLYEIVRERHHSNGSMDGGAHANNNNNSNVNDQEWMYALQQQSAGDVNEKIMEAMELCAVGRGAEGWALWKQLRAQHSSEVPFRSPLQDLLLLQMRATAADGDPSTPPSPSWAPSAPPIAIAARSATLMYSPAGRRGQCDDDFSRSTTESSSKQDGGGSRPTGTGMGTGTTFCASSISTVCSS